MRQTVIALAATASVALTHFAAPAWSTDFFLRVGRSTNSEFPGHKVPEVVSYMSAIFNGSQYTGVDCEVNFTLSENTIITAPDSVDTSSDLQTLFQTSQANVVVVRFLNYCGGYSPAWSGCSDDNLNVVVDNEVGLGSPLALQTNAVLWLHEFGHSQHLSHNSGTNNMMRASVNGDNLLITSAQCDNFMRDNNRFDPGAGAAVQGLGLSQQIVVGQDPVERLLFAAWNGIPTNDIREIITDPAILRAILMDRAKVELWPNAIFALGVVGDVSDVQFLLFLHQNYAALLVEPPATETVIRARTRVPVALAMLGSTFGPESQAFEIISRILNEGQGEGGRAGLDEEAFSQLVNNALFGLASQKGLGFAEARANIEGQAARIRDFDIAEEQLSTILESGNQARESGLIEYLSVRE